MKDRKSGEPTRTGFVTFKSIETAKEALEALNGALTPTGEKIALAYSHPKRFKKPRIAS